VVVARALARADDSEPLLGVTALESAGIEVDPSNQKLKRLPAVRLKRLAD
jgi:predicted aspartyl protease